MKDRSFWELVRYVSQQRGVLIKNLGREKFGDMLIHLCPKAVSKSDTKGSLKYNMDKFKFNNKLNEDAFKKLPDKHVLRQYVDELNSLFDERPAQDTTNVEKTTYTIQDRLKEYLDADVDKEQYAKVLVRPTYCNYPSTFSVEQYVSKRFYEEGRPSRIIVYECVDGRVDDSKVVQLAGQYMEDRRIKLYIASMYGYSNRTISVASNRYVGLIRINPNKVLDEKCFTLPRSSEDYGWRSRCNLMLKGQLEMTVPIIIRNAWHISVSLADELAIYDIAVKDSARLDVPVLSYEVIEAKAYELIKVEVEKYEKLLSGFDYRRHDVPFCVIDTYKLAYQLGLSVEWCNLSEKHQLAYIDMVHRRMVLSDKVHHFITRERFSMGHEIGHEVLHSDLGFDSFIETNSTLSLDIDKRKLLERQANQFASCLLMPERIVRELYRIYWQKEFGSYEVQPLKYNGPIDVFQRIVGPVSRKMDVSMEAMKIRLTKLGLIRYPDLLPLPTPTQLSSDTFFPSDFS